MEQPDAQQTRHLDAVLTWNVVRVARFVGNRFADRLADHQVNPIQFGVLAFLAQEGEMTTASIARSVLLRPQSVTPLLDGLEQRGLLQRSGTRSQGRPNPVQITRAGLLLLDDVWGIAIAANDLGDAGLTAAESQELNRLLLKIASTTKG